jgi:hypothetical protein
MPGEQPVLPEQPKVHQDPTFVDAYREANADILSRLDLVEGPEGWNEAVENVIVVLCASRSGSSLIFKALSSTGEVAAPAGEHEAWLSLTENKYPFIDSDDTNGFVHQKEQLLRLIRNDLLVRDAAANGEALRQQLWNRLVIRRQDDDPGFHRTLSLLPKAGEFDAAKWAQVNSEISQVVPKPQPTRIEDFPDRSFGIPLENPPLITIPVARLATDQELGEKTLLFKSPSDVYRPGFYEELFPNASIAYVHLTRGFVQTTNGLMDGWQQNEIDFISNPVGITKPLQIEDYSITDMTRTYWCFDLFKDWEDFTNRPLLEVCTQQWLAAHRSAIERFTPTQQLTFEHFYSDPDGFYKELTELTGVDTTKYDWSRSVMSTETPSAYRWLKRGTIFKNLGQNLPGALLKEVVELQSELGYSMEEETWH